MNHVHNILFIYFIYSTLLFCPVQDLPPLQGGNRRLGLPPWQWHSEPFLAGRRRGLHLHPQVQEWLCIKSFFQFILAILKIDIHNYLGRHDPSAKEGYPFKEVEDGKREWPNGDVDFVGEADGRGRNINIPFLGPAVSIMLNCMKICQNWICLRLWETKSTWQSLSPLSSLWSVSSSLSSSLWVLVSLQPFICFWGYNLAALDILKFCTIEQ